MGELSLSCHEFSLFWWEMSLFYHMFDCVAVGLTVLL